MNSDIQKRLDDLVGFAKKNGLEELCWEDNGVKISFRRGAKAFAGERRPLNQGSQEKTPAEELIRSPMVGTFRRSLAKDRPPVVVEGSHVKPGDKLAIVECMKIPNDVVSYHVGQITKILVDDGQIVEYGQPLFSVAGKNGRPSGKKK